jgi:hypothetical protein
MSTANLDAENLRLQPENGLIHEDVMDKLYALDPVKLPFQDSIGSGSASNVYKEWASEVLESANPDNATVDGADAGNDESVIGNRYGNYCQLASKVVKVSDRGRAVNTIGHSDELAHQILRRTKALHTDVEASLLSNNAAIAATVDANNHATGASKSAGVGAWILTNNVGPGDFVAATLSGTTGGAPTTPATAGTAAAGSETNVREAMNMAYKEGGMPSLAISTLECINLFSDYLFTSSARVATLQSNAPQSNRTGAGSGNGISGGGITAQGAVNIFVTNTGTLELCPDIYQPEVAADVADLYLIDPDYWEVAYLQGYQTKMLNRTGTSENRQITVDFTLCALNERSSAAVRSIDLTTPFIA